MTDQPRVARPVAEPTPTESGPRSPAPPDRRTRRTIATTPDYAEAERIVDQLSDRGFPVERVAIVGHDLQVVEQVVGRMTWGRAALNGALSGAFPGVLFGWIFGLFSWVDPLIAAAQLGLYGLVIGAVLGAVVGLVLYGLQRGRRDFASVPTMRPTRYEVVVDPEVADEALRLLGTER
jgi:hypothetical protein